MNYENSQELEQKCDYCFTSEVIERQYKGMFIQTISASRTTALWVEYPFLECGACGEQWSDHRAKNAKDKALKEWLSKDILENLEAGNVE